jgi:mannan polymerase II complex MNN10 subunit
LTRWYRRTSFLGGGSKFVIILAANPGGGVSEWKGGREYAIEKASMRNKQRYADRWGYTLEVANLVDKKEYSHEWRAGWEKVDIIKNAMRKHRDAEW